MQRRRPAGDVLLRMALDARMRRLVESKSLSHEVVRRYVAGESVSSALDVAGELLVRGRRVSITHLVSDPFDHAQAKDRRKRLRKLLRRLGQAGMTRDARVEVSLRLRALGAGLGSDGVRLAVDHARVLCRTAAEAGTRITLETEHELAIGTTLQAFAELRDEHPQLGIALQACERRTETDCRDLAGTGARVRLGKGTPRSTEHLDAAALDRAYVRCLRTLMASPATPVVATHDLRILAIAAELAERVGRPSTSFEYQLRYGVRPAMQTVVADRGDVMRVYVPFGEEWYPYLISRVADRPNHVVALVRAATAR